MDIMTFPHSPIPLPQDIPVPAFHYVPSSGAALPNSALPQMLATHKPVPGPITTSASNSSTSFPMLSLPPEQTTKYKKKQPTHRVIRPGIIIRQQTLPTVQLRRLTVRRKLKHTRSGPDIPRTPRTTQLRFQICTQLTASPRIRRRRLVIRARPRHIRGVRQPILRVIESAGRGDHERGVAAGVANESGGAAGERSGRDGGVDGSCGPGCDCRLSVGQDYISSATLDLLGRKRNHWKGRNKRRTP